MENFNHRPIITRNIPRNSEHLSYKKKLFINNVNTELNYYINSTVSPFNDYNTTNDNEENIINTDSTIDTDKTKYVYIKKRNFTKKRPNFIKTKKNNLMKKDCLAQTTAIKPKKDQKRKTARCFSSSKYMAMGSNKFKRIKNVFLDNNISLFNTVINLNNYLKTSNNFFKRNRTIDSDEKMSMSNTSSDFHKRNKTESIEETINSNNKINIYICMKKLITFEEKYKKLIQSINSKIKKNINNECLDLINYFYKALIYKKIEIFFNKNAQSQLIINKSIKLIIFCTILAYYISFDESYLHTCLDYLATIINISHKSYLLLCEQIINRINDLNENILIDKLYFIVQNNLFHIDINDNDFIKYLSARKYNISNISKKKINFIYEIKYYSFLIQKYIKVLLKNLNNNTNNNLKEELTSIFNNIKDLSFQELDYLFQKNIKKEEKIEKTEKNDNDVDDIPQKDEYPPADPEIVPPYIKESLTKKFSLVLDLDETLISLERKKINDENKGILKFRPGLLKFLTKIRKYYEIIVFTSGTREYGEQILEAIENGKNYFDYKLFREHTLVHNNEFIKDLSRIGRPLDKIIIVDNMPQNYRLQKENGIEIKPFYGEDINDKALEHLGNILKKIVNKFEDVRDGISEYKNEIKNKIGNCV
jgi:Dullard-like phosphatase family protein